VLTVKYIKGVDSGDGWCHAVLHLSATLIFHVGLDFVLTIDIYGTRSDLTSVCQMLEYLYPFILVLEVSKAKILCCVQIRK